MFPKQFKNPSRAVGKKMISAFFLRKIKNSNPTCSSVEVN